MAHFHATENDSGPRETPLMLEEAVIIAENTCNIGVLGSLL